MGGLFEYVTIPAGTDTGGTEALFVLRCAFAAVCAFLVVDADVDAALFGG